MNGLINTDIPIVTSIMNFISKLRSLFKIKESESAQPPSGIELTTPEQPPVQTQEAVLPAEPQVQVLHHDAIIIPKEPFKYSDSEFLDRDYEKGEDGSWIWKTYYADSDVTEVKSWRKENELAAKALLDLHGDALTIFHDGTFASQIMLQSFKDAGKIPRVFSVVFGGEETRLLPLYEIYNKESFGLRLINADLNQFWNMSAPNLNAKHNVISHVEAVKIFASTAAAGVPVFAGGIPFIKVQNNEWYLGDHEQYFIIDTKVRNYEETVVPAFFRYTKGQLMSFMGQSQKIILESGMNNSFDSQMRIYSSFYDDMDFAAESEMNDYEREFEHKSRIISPKAISICWHKLK